jgi:mono/diheme cytochrome c family protein
VRGQYVLVMNAVVVVLLMALMGFARSASRVHWHVYGVLEDTSAYAYTPALGQAAVFMSVSALLFFLMLVFLFWVLSRTLRYPAFSTQYFFLAPFVFWATSFSEKSAVVSMPQVSERPKYFRKAVWTVCGILIAYTYLSYQIPQKVSLPPERGEFNFSQVSSTKELVRVGQKIFFGKGQCALCHSIGPSPVARAPDLQGIGAKLTREFLYESLTQPEAYIYKQYDQEGSPRVFPARMPAINKPPVGLSEPELLAVMAYVQSLGGEVTIQPEEVKAAMLATVSSGEPAGGNNPSTSR